MVRTINNYNSVQRQVNVLLSEKSVLVHNVIVYDFLAYCDMCGINIHGGAIAPNGQFFYID